MHRRLPTLAFAIVFAGAAGSLSGCVPVAAVTAGAAVASSASEERGLGGTAEDTGIELAIHDKWLQHDSSFITTFEMTVRGGRVLLMGVVAEQAKVDTAVRLAWEVGGVKEVLNEVEVQEPGGLADFSRDVWIAQRLRSSLLLDADVRSINYTVDVVNGSVYLLGFARTQTELDKVVNQARNLSYVRRVVSHVRMISAGETEPSS